MAGEIPTRTKGRSSAHPARRQTRLHAGGSDCVIARRVEEKNVCHRCFSEAEASPFTPTFLHRALQEEPPSGEEFPSVADLQVFC
jgi:hypothetical protein